MTRAKVWWGGFSLAAGQRGRWRIGPLDLWLERRERELRAAMDRPREPLDSTVQVTVPVRQRMPEAPAERLRFAGLEGENGIELLPALAERPVVSRPESPFYIPAQGRVTLYVSTMLWAQLRAGGLLLHEFPIHRPSDTWFGPSTTDGELAYASRTHCRLSLDEVPKRPHRAVTPVTIENQAGDALFLERLNLPVPSLGLFADERNQLWTQALHLQRRADRELTDIRMDAGAPAEAAGAVQLAAPRQAGSRHFLGRAFSALFQ